MKIFAKFSRLTDGMQNKVPEPPHKFGDMRNKVPEPPHKFGGVN